MWRLMFLLILNFNVLLGQNKNDEISKEAICYLESNLHIQQKWTKVHVAEYLIQVNQKDNIASVFCSENQIFGNENQYRIGIWRVLAQEASSDATRGYWIGKIIDAYTDETSLDKLHAVESLAKLKIPPPNSNSNDHIKEFYKEINPLSIYSLWASAYYSIEDQEKVLKVLLAALYNDNTSDANKSLIAYSVGRLGFSDLKLWKEFTENALTYKNVGAAKVNFITSAYLSMIPDSRKDTIYKSLHQELLKLRLSPRINDHTQLAIALGFNSDEASLPVLQKLFYRNYLTKNVDQELKDRVKLAAAFAILKVLSDKS